MRAKKYIFILFAFCALGVSGYGQSFAKTYTIFRSGYYGVSVIPTDSEQTAVLGYVPFTVIVDSIGNEKYTNTNYPYIGNPNAANIIQTSSGYVFFMSYGWGNMGNPNYQNLIFINDTLNTINPVNFFTGYYSSTDYINLYNVTNNGVFFTCTCFTHSSAFPYTEYPTTFISNYDSAGNLLWTHDFGPNYTAVIYNSIITSDSNLAVLGEINDTLQLEKFDFNGNLLFDHKDTMGAYNSELIEVKKNIIAFGNVLDTAINKYQLAIEIITLNDSLITRKKFILYNDTVNVYPIAVYPETDTTVVLNYTISGSTLNYYLIVNYRGDSIGSFTLPAYTVSASENGNILCELDTNNEILVREYTPQEKLVYQYIYPFGTSNTCKDIKPLPYPGGFVLTGSSNNDLLIIRQDTTYINIKTTSLTNINCNGNNNGAAILMTVGGTAPYTYSWAPYGGTNSSASGLSAGNYTVTVTDNKGNSNNIFVTVTQPAILLSNLTVSSSACSNNNGSVRDSVSGGTSPYTYLWSNGRTNDTILSLASGDYACTVTDSRGCSKTDTIFVHLGATVGIFSTNLTCGGVNTGSIRLSLSGNYSYNWSPGVSTGDSATGLSAGTYSVTITNIDTISCMQTYFITITQPPALSANLHVNTAPCNIMQQIISSVSGGTAPYTYAWSTGGSGTSVSFDVYCPPAITNDSLLVTDHAGCSITKSVILTPAIGWVNQLVTNVSCNNGDNGAITLQVCGGTAPYTYSWVFGEGISNNPTYTISNLRAGNYLVNVYDSNFCSVGNVFLTITQPLALSIIADSTADNGVCNGTAWVQVSGGTPSYSYLWTGGLTTDTITNQCGGYYCSTITDANGCMDSACITIPSPTGINEPAAKSEELRIYPNPNDGIFTIESGALKVENGKTQIEVYNILGEQVFFQFSTFNFQFSIDLSSQPNGIYLYRVLTGNGRIVGEGKFVIQR